MRLDALVASAVPFLGPVRLISKSDIRTDWKKHNDSTFQNIMQTVHLRPESRVCYLSTYDPAYPWTHALVAIMRRCGLSPDVLLLYRRPFALLWFLLAQARSYDCIVLGFRGHALLPLLRLAAGRKVTIIFDAFVSVFDTACGDRRSVRADSMLGKFLHVYDRWLCRLSDIVLIDTNAHADYFRTEFGCDHIHTLYVESDDTLFHGTAQPVPRPDGTRIVWYGSCIPLHGVEKILHWAKTLEADPSVHFTLIGPVEKKYGSLLAQLQLTNVDLLPWVAQKDLPGIIRSATLCLGGPFGDSGKAHRVIAAKTYQTVSCGCPTLIADTPVHREIFA